jgi:hypothetical protein
MFALCAVIDDEGNCREFVGVSPPHYNTLYPWSSSDWNTDDLFTNPSFVEKQYIYLSSLALPAGPNKVMGSDYRTHNDRTEFSGVNPGVPGPFDYSEGYEFWGGDNVLDGKARYSEIISHFGHTHILSVQGKVRLEGEDSCADTTAEDKMLDHLLGASTQIFNWYAQLVDNDGNFVNLQLEHPIVGQLKGLMGMLINGWGTPNMNGEVDMNIIISAMSGFVSQFSQGPAHSALLNAELDRLVLYLQDVLRFGLDDEIPFLAWYQLMDIHQRGSVSYGKLYREAYKTNPSSNNYQAARDSANTHTEFNTRMGRQLASFFGAFYTLTNFLDKFYIPQLPGDDYAIPEMITNQRLNYVLESQKNLWYQHTILFQDWHKAVALGDLDVAYRINVALLESCTPLASSIGIIFEDFDTLIRRRHIYQALSQIPL